jgi:hypothetical protein
MTCIFLTRISLLIEEKAKRAYEEKGGLKREIL